MGQHNSATLMCAQPDNMRRQQFYVMTQATAMATNPETLRLTTKKHQQGQENTALAQPGVSDPDRTMDRINLTRRDALAHNPPQIPRRCRPTTEEWDDIRTPSSRATMVRRQQKAAQRHGATTSSPEPTPTTVSYASPDELTATVFTTSRRHRPPPPTSMPPDMGRDAGQPAWTCKTDPHCYYITRTQDRRAWKTGSWTRGCP